MHHEKLTYLRGKLDAAIDVNVMPAHIYIKLDTAGDIQGNFKVYNSTSINVIGLCVLSHYAHNKTTEALSFNVTNKKGSVLLSCGEILVLGLVLESDKPDRKIPSSAKPLVS